MQEAYQKYREELPLLQNMPLGQSKGSLPTASLSVRMQDSSRFGVDVLEREGQYNANRLMISLGIRDGEEASCRRQRQSF